MCFETVEKRSVGSLSLFPKGSKFLLSDQQETGGCSAADTGMQGATTPLNVPLNASGKSQPHSAV